MALPNQPYFPFYVGDWMNSNKLKMCSPAAHGLMIAIMCIMHKEQNYGTILLKQKFRQTSKQIKNFASQIARLSAFSPEDIEEPLTELINENLLTIKDDTLICLRMVKDCELSINKAKAGKAGGTTTMAKKNSAKANKVAKSQANNQANSEIENEDGNEDGSVIVVDNGKEGTGEKPDLVYPFETETFRAQWRVWKDYRTNEHKFAYKSAVSEQAALNELGNVSQYDEANAIAIMHQSIANGWKGFFEVVNHGAKQPSAKGGKGYSDTFKRKIANRLQSG